jgi:hypothetical protein
MSKQEALERFDKRVHKQIYSLPWYAYNARRSAITYAAIIRLELVELWNEIERLKDEHSRST